MSESATATAAVIEALGDAVRTFLDLPVVVRNLRADRSWDNEWMEPHSSLRGSDLRRLADALAAFDARPCEGWVRYAFDVDHGVETEFHTSHDGPCDRRFGSAGHIGSDAAEEENGG